MGIHRGRLRKSVVRMSYGVASKAPTKIDRVIALVAGRRVKASSKTDFTSLLEDLKVSLATVFSLLEDSRAAATVKDQAVLPYAARSFLELAINILIARMDPFRVLALRKCQLGAEYDLGARAGMALSWMGDVYTKDGDKTPSWSPEKQPQTVSRALLDKPWSELAWTPAFERAKDHLSLESGDWMTEVRGFDIERFFPVARGRILSIYSSLSKGVHHELVIPRETLLDQTTLRTVTTDLVKWISLVSYVSHFVDHAAMSLSATSAVEQLRAIQSYEESR